MQTTLSKSASKKASPPINYSEVLKRLTQKSLTLLLPCLGLGLALLVWQVGLYNLAESKPIFKSFLPENTWESFLNLLQRGTLFSHSFSSLLRVGVGMLWAVVLGVPLGLLLGFWRPFDKAFSSLFQFLRMTSPISWMPLAVMILGIGNPSIFFLLAIAAVWPVLFNTAAAVENLDKRYLSVAKSLGANPFETHVHVTLPAILPQIFTGLRLALGLTWVVLVPAEMLGVRSGLGYLILDARDRLAYGEVMALILVIGLIGYLLDTALKAIISK